MRKLDMTNSDHVTEQTVHSSGESVSQHETNNTSSFTNI